LYLSFDRLGYADEIVFICVIFVDDDDAFKQKPIGVVFVEIVAIFVPIIVVAHKAEVALVGVPSIQPPSSG
jgi:hypothetical protein